MLNARFAPGAIALALLLCLAACGEHAAAPAGPAPVPPDPKLAKLYAQTCKACHSNAASGAPRTGDVEAWAPRMAKGLPTLLDHVINGYKGMPPLGSCSDCSEAEFRALIEFMATGK